MLCAGLISAASVSTFTSSMVRRDGRGWRLAAGRRWPARPQLSASTVTELIRAAIEPMNGARFVHDRLEPRAGRSRSRTRRRRGAGAAGLQDRPHRRLGAGRARRRDLVPAIWLPDPSSVPARACPLAAAPGAPPLEPEATRAQSCSRTASHGPSPICSACAAASRAARPGLPEPWQGTIEASLRLIDELDREITHGEREPRCASAPTTATCCCC